MMSESPRALGNHVCEGDSTRSSLLPHELEAFSEGLVAEEPSRVLAAAVELRRLLSRSQAPFVQGVQPLVPKLAKLIRSQPPADLLLELLWIFTNLCSISPKDTELILEAGILPDFVKLVAYDHAAISIQSAWIIGNVADDFRDQAVRAGAIPALLKLWPHAKKCSARMVTLLWALGNCVRGKPLVGKAPRVAAGRAAADSLLLSPELSGGRDLELRREATTLLMHCADLDPVREHIWASPLLPTMLLSMTMSESLSFVVPSVRVLGEMMASEDVNEVQRLLDLGFLDFVNELLRGRFVKSVAKDCLWAISNVAAGTPGQVRELVAHPSLATISERLPEFSQPSLLEALWIYSNLAASEEPCVREKVFCGLRSNHWAGLARSVRKFLQTAPYGQAIFGIEHSLSVLREFFLDTGSDLPKSPRQISEISALLEVLRALRLDEHSLAAAHRRETLGSLSRLLESEAGAEPQGPRFCCQVQESSVESSSEDACECKLESRAALRLLCRPELDALAEEARFPPARPSENQGHRNLEEGRPPPLVLLAAGFQELPEVMEALPGEALPEVDLRPPPWPRNPRLNNPRRERPEAKRQEEARARGLLPLQPEGREPANRLRDRPSLGEGGPRPKPRLEELLLLRAEPRSAGAEEATEPAPRPEQQLLELRPELRPELQPFRQERLPLERARPEGFLREGEGLREEARPAPENPPREVPPAPPREPGKGPAEESRRELEIQRALELFHEEFRDRLRELPVSAGSSAESSDAEPGILDPELSEREEWVAWSELRLAGHGLSDDEVSLRGTSDDEDDRLGEDPLLEEAPCGPEEEHAEAQGPLGEPTPDVESGLLPAEEAPDEELQAQCADDEEEPAYSILELFGSIFLRGCAPREAKQLADLEPEEQKLPRLAPKPLAEEPLQRLAPETPASPELVSDRPPAAAGEAAAGEAAVAGPDTDVRAQLPAEKACETEPACPAAGLSSWLVGEASGPEPSTDSRGDAVTVAPALHSAKTKARPKFAKAPWFGFRPESLFSGSCPFQALFQGLLGQVLWGKQRRPRCFQLPPGTEDIKVPAHHRRFLEQDGLCEGVFDRCPVLRLMNWEQRQSLQRRFREEQLRRGEEARARALSGAPARSPETDDEDPFHLFRIPSLKFHLV